MIRMLEQEVRIGYWPHIEFDWTDAVRTACELSAEHSLKRTVRSMDLFHIAITAASAALNAYWCIGNGICLKTNFTLSP